VHSGPGSLSEAGARVADMRGTHSLTALTHLHSLRSHTPPALGTWAHCTTRATRHALELLPGPQLLRGSWGPSNTPLSRTPSHRPSPGNAFAPARSNQSQNALNVITRPYDAINPARARRHSSSRPISERTRAASARSLFAPTASDLPAASARRPLACSSPDA
jgi:hypothetical protein